MAGFSSSQFRAGFVVEVTPNTTPATPAFKTTHSPILFNGDVTRINQNSLVSRGARMGDGLLSKPSVGKMSGPMVYSAYDSLLESLFQATFTTNALTDGKALQTVSCESTMTAGLGGTTKYIRNTGVEVMDGTLKVDARGNVNMDLTLMGMQGGSTTGSAIAGATYADPTNNDPYASNADLGNITLAGYTLDGIASMTINFKYEDRANSPQAVLGTDTLIGFPRGNFRPEIMIKCYLDTNFTALHDIARVASQTPAKFTANFGNVTLKKYRMEFWECYVSLAKPNFDGPNAFMDITILPAYSVTNSGVMTLTRALV